MTYRREKGTIEDTFDECLKHLSPKEIEKATGLKNDTVQRYSRPTTNTSIPYVVAIQIDAILSRKGLAPLMQKSGDRVFQDALNRLGGPMAVEDELPSTKDIRREVNEFLDAHEEALRDGVVDEKELNRVEAELLDVSKAVAHCLEKISAVRHTRSLKVVEGTR